MYWNQYEKENVPEPVPVPKKGTVPEKGPYRNRYEVYGNLATAWHALGKYEEAIYAYEIAVNMNNNMSTSNSTTDNSENNDSSTITHSIRATGSPNVVTLSNYAICLCTLSRYDEGLLILERAKEICMTSEFDSCMGTTGTASGVDNGEEAERGRVERVDADLLRAITACSI